MKVPLLKLKSRIRELTRKASFVIRKKAYFKQFHFEEALVDTSIIFKFGTRVRKLTKKANFTLRKKAKFVQIYTGLQPSVPRFVTRSRKKLKSKFKRFAKFLVSNPDQALISNSVQIVQFKTHKRYKLKQKKNKFKLVSPIHSGIQQSTSVIFMKTRRRSKIRYKKYKGYRMNAWRFNGVNPIVAKGTNWLPTSLASYTRRGGD